MLCSLVRAVPVETAEVAIGTGLARQMTKEGVGAPDVAPGTTNPTGWTGAWFVNKMFASTAAVTCAEIAGL